LLLETFSDFPAEKLIYLIYEDVLRNFERTGVGLIAAHLNALLKSNMK
jgi:hypothetical protein